ncbi:MAG: ATP-dependent RecD-like DNA helicase [Breznakia sp.]
MEEYIEGHFQYIIYRNDSNYTVAVFLLDAKQAEKITVTGYLGELEEDMLYRLYGRYTEHPRYGLQYAIDHYESVLPSDRATLVKYFSSALFPGVGKRTAEKIADQLGGEGLQRLQEDMDLLTTLAGVNDKQIESLRRGLNNELDDSIVFLTRHGIHARHILKIEAIYADKAIAIIKDNPYQLIVDVDGIGFKTADKLAMHLGFTQEDPKRVKAAITACVLDMCMKSGNSFEKKDQVCAQVRKQLSFLKKEVLEVYLEELCKEKLLIMEKDDVYHHTQYEAELGISTFLYHFPYSLKNIETTIDLDNEIHLLETIFHIQYDKKQKAAIKIFFEESFSILSGGPGTGKTTIVRAIIELYKKLYANDEIALCAPTGRAAKRLSELSGVSATTVHSLLKWDLETNRFGVDATNPIAADLLIVDECSMMDAWLFYKLLIASKQISKILIIGDVDQLPSVGPGFVLKDLVQSKVFKLTMLDKVYRQAQGSDVIRLAHDIRQGSLQTFQQANDIKFFSCENYQINEQIIKIVDSAFMKGYDEFDIQILAPMYRGVAGIDAINRHLQSICNPAQDDKNEVHVGHKIFRENDKVLQLKNQPDDGVYNGDIGKIIEIRRGQIGTSEKEIIVDFDNIIVAYTTESFMNITHAYCISIHKAQGSEYPIIIMPVVKDYYYMLQRRLLYTGITRAKKSLILLGDKEIFYKGIQKADTQPRFTKLAMRLCTMKEDPFY